MAKGINFDIIELDVLSYLKGRKFSRTSWSPEDPGIKFDVSFKPKKKNGIPASRARRHTVHIWRDRTFKGKYIMAIFYTKNGQSVRYSNDRGLTEEQINNKLVELSF